MNNLIPPANWNKWAEDTPALIKADITPAPPLTVETLDNHIYFYSDVDTDRCLALIRQLRELDRSLQAEHRTRDLGDEFQVPIWLHINSRGGDLFAALAVADQISRIGSPIYSIGEGLVASAATLISVACTRRFVQPSAYMLVHQFTSWFYGTHEEFKDEMELQEMLIARMVTFYEQYTSMSADDLREKLKRDFWMNAEKAVEFGFADGVLLFKNKTG